jgi:hypothetical protein
LLPLFELYLLGEGEGDLHLVLESRRTGDREGDLAIKNQASGGPILRIRRAWDKNDEILQILPADVETPEEVAADESQKTSIRE